MGDTLKIDINNGNIRASIKQSCCFFNVLYDNINYQYFTDSKSIGCF